MLPALVLLCLITRENLAFSTKRISHTLTAPSVGQIEFGKTSTRKTTQTNVSDNVLVHNFVRKEALAKAGNRGIKEKKGNSTRKGTIGSGKNAPIRSIIPFTEATFSVQFNDARTESTNSMDNANSKKQTDFLFSPITSYKNPLARFKLKGGDTGSTTIHPYHTWQYVFQNPRIFRTVESISENDKAKDKRYTDVIPLQKQLPGASFNQYSYLSPIYKKDSDNPVFGDQAFFSFILNDYFDRSIDDDPVLFKDQHWGKEFDIEPTGKRIRRLETGDYSKSITAEPQAVNYDAKFAKENLYKRMNEAGAQKDNYSENSNGFKSLVETFAQKFGSSDDELETQSKIKREDADLNFITKHANELQSSDELLDELVAACNDGKLTDEDTTSVSKISGFEQFLYNYESSSASSVSVDLTEYASSNISRLRYLAKSAALVNNADYIDTSEYAI
ncbi:unnamed protein product, partial [Iphiclides podalirius]